METVQLVNQFKGTHVVGFDIAADEAKGAESVWETLKNFYPSRIGHGVRSAEDTSLLSFLKANNIHLEVCPTSNVQTNVFNKIEDHTADTIYNAGVSMSINTDARTISNVTLADEYKLLEQVFQWSKEHFKKCNLEAIKHSFASVDIKEKIRQQIENAY